MQDTDNPKHDNNIFNAKLQERCLKTGRVDNLGDTFNDHKSLIKHIVTVVSQKDFLGYISNTSCS